MAGGGTSNIKLRQSDLTGDCTRLNSRLGLMDGLTAKVQSQVDDLAAKVGGTSTTAAAAAASGLGYPGITTRTTVTGTRAFTTVYRNTRGVPLFVNVMTASGVAMTVFQAFTDAAAAPTQPAAISSIPPGLGQNTTLSFWVLPNHYYKVTSTGGSIYSWVEWY